MDLLWTNAANDNNHLVQLLPGEVRVTQDEVDGKILFITNYRFFVHMRRPKRVLNIPLGLIENVVQDGLVLDVNCKDGRIVKLHFDQNETCTDWSKKLSDNIIPPRKYEDVFAFKHFTKITKDAIATSHNYQDTFSMEVARMRFDTHGAWRITSANIAYELCPTYPPQLLVPACITDETLVHVAAFRAARRLPVVVWRHIGNGNVVARCSQPEVGLLGWRSEHDESFIQAISDASSFDCGRHSMIDDIDDGISDRMDESMVTIPTQEMNGDQICGEEKRKSKNKKKLLILDARSYATATANRARGGGFEFDVYYPCEICFLGLANIHAIRRSFQAMRALLAQNPEVENWLTLFDNTKWLGHISIIILAAKKLVNAIEYDQRSVLVHCSDGWDRTPQIVALGELLLDPYYRTIQGFRVLCEKEWLDFGHKFEQRNGVIQNDLPNERSPIFMQWLDCVYQVLCQFPCHFEFSKLFLVKLAKHQYSNLFGTFLCNSRKEREDLGIHAKTLNIWSFLSDNPRFRNHLYLEPDDNTERVLNPSHYVRDLKLWSELYAGQLEKNVCDCTVVKNITETGTASVDINTVQTPLSHTQSAPVDDIAVGASQLESSDKINGHKTDKSSAMQTHHHISKTRSYDNLIDNTMDSVIEELSSATRDLKIEKLKRFKSDDQLNVNSAKKIDDCLECHANVVTDLFKDDVISNGLNEAMRTNLVTAYDLKLTPTISGYDDVDSDDSNLRTFNSHINGFENVKADNSSAPATPAFLSYSCYNSELDGIEAALTDATKNLTLDADCFDSKTDICETPQQAAPTSTVTPSNAIPIPMSNDSHRCVSSINIASNTCCECDNLENTQTTMCANTNTKCSNNSRVGSWNMSDFSDACSDSIGTSTDTVIADAHSSQRQPAVLLYLDKHDTNGNTSSPLHPIAPDQIIDTRFDPDGLAPLNCCIQNRVQQIKNIHVTRIKALEKELQATREALVQQACHNCTGFECQDDSCSIGGSVHSTDSHFSTNESLPSSWEAVEDTPFYNVVSTNNLGTFWVPDHVVSRCASCDSEFWLGRRKHHCRNCGNIFCADCSLKTPTLVSDDESKAIRVCASCYEKISAQSGNKVKVKAPEYRPLFSNSNQAPTYSAVVKKSNVTTSMCNDNANFSSTNPNLHDMPEYTVVKY